MAPPNEIHGRVDPAFAEVKAAFAANFAELGDVGASCAVYVDGAPVVDLWGGLADPSSGRAWAEDTIALVYSATKGASAVVTSLLAQRGELDVDAPVASLWPEFAAAGKQSVTIRQVLSHQAGLAAVDERLDREQLIAGTPVVEALAAQAPAWEPGSAHGYHALTFGWLVGEIVKRATGRSLGTVFASEVAAPLGLDFHIGLPSSEEVRVAPLINPSPPDPALIEAIPDPDLRAFVQRMMADLANPESYIARVLSTNGALPTPEAATWNDSRIHAMEQPAANGITNARSLARMYGAVVAEAEGVRLLTDATLDEMTREQSSGPDHVTRFPSRFGTGFMLPSPNVPMLSASSFGHVGAGGAMGFADRDRRVGFGYVPNQLAGGAGGDPRVAALVGAVARALDV